MAFQHRSSASFSSLSLSRNSLASSSESSPTSSPDSSATPTSLLSQGCSIIVPFSWEEKPGVLKKDITASSHLSTPSTLHRAVNAGAEHLCTAAGHEKPQSSFGQETRRTLLRQPTAAYFASQVQLPPYLSHHELQARMIGGSECTSVLPSTHRNNHYNAAAGAGSKIVRSLSRQKRRPHRRRASPEDDPFWLAMMACTNDAEEDRRNNKAFLANKASRTDTWLARRVQERVHLDRCMPRHGQSGNHTFSREVQIHRTHYKAISQVTRSVDSDQSSGKAVKALGMAREESQDECRPRSHHHSPPVVDISCRSHRAAWAKVGLASKHKLP